MEEIDRVGISAVLAADAELEARVRLAAEPAGEAHEPADARLVDRLERAAVDDLPIEVHRDELRLGIVAAEPERGLRQVVRTEREEVGVPRDRVRARARTR